MKDDYLKGILFLLVLVVIIQGYFLYDVNRTINEKQVSVKVGESLFLPSMVPFVGFFDRKEDPFLEMERIRHEIDSRFINIEDFFQTVPSLKPFYFRFYRTPSYDMKEQDGKYIITMEVPGLDKNEINIKTEDGKLIVSASISKEKDNNTTTYYQRERRTSSYRHVTQLPIDANEKSLHSEYKDGLLSITFEKTLP